MPEELPKVYSPQEVEKKWYKFWEENRFFSPDDSSTKEPFVIVIPPPNITGSLHMGHALDNSLQDVLIRYKRMQGFKTLWVPGTDHAGIATQNVVERAIKKEGKTKHDLGRKKFVARVWDWKKEYGDQIINQLKRLGASCDWARTRFTMDEGLSRAVRREFVELYKEGLIYRGKRIINWCPRCGTALSDIEVDYTTKKGKLWYLKYPLEKSAHGKEYIVVATTRPETMLGDTAVAINPHDKRYKHMLGKSLILPLVGRRLPIIKDDFVDPEFGTGAVKVTPAHDPNDYEIGERHNLPKINVLTSDAKITFAEFEGQEKVKVKKLEKLDRFKAREKLVAMLDEAGYLEKTEDYENAVGGCYRCKEIVEPYLSDQWFVKIKPLAEEGIKVVEEGHIKFVPARWTKVYLQWMTNLKDWCISRQLWWGHQIPVWYCSCGEVIVAEEKPTKCSKCGESKLGQDPDVFDTWFSSALWPFSTLGWPEKTSDLKTYYPTSVLVTGYDIITFWVSRMIMTGMHFMKKEPFKTVYIHGLVRDIHGKKMSKSKGNVIDPLGVINEYGADALRFALTSLVTAGGQDLKLSQDKMTEARNFANKIWNVSRFVLMNLGEGMSEGWGEEFADRWILSRYHQTVKTITGLLDDFDFGEAARKVYEFLWNEFCDWYVEMAKPRLYQSGEKEKKAVQAVLVHVLEGTLKLLHPFMPFITEEIWQKLVAGKKTIMLSEWPKAEEEFIDPKIDAQMELLMEVTRVIRNIRAEVNVPSAKEVEVILVAAGKKEREILSSGSSYIRVLTKARGIEIKEKIKEKLEQAATAVVKNIEIYLPLKGLIDIDKEVKRLEKEIEDLDKEIARVQKKLANKEFLAKARKEVVEKERGKEANYKKEKEKNSMQLFRLKTR